MRYEDDDFNNGVYIDPDYSSNPDFRREIDALISQDCLFDDPDDITEEWDLDDYDEGLEL